MLDGPLWIFVSTVLSENPEASSAVTPGLLEWHCQDWACGISQSTCSRLGRKEDSKGKEESKGSMIGDDMRNALNMLSSMPD